MKKGMRAAALGLAAALCFNLTPAWAFAEEAEGDGGDSSSEFVGAFDLRDIFEFKQTAGRGGYISENFMHLADRIDSAVNSADNSLYSDSSGVFSHREVSLQSNWEFESNFSLQVDKSKVREGGAVQFVLMDEETDETFAFVQLGKLAGREGYLIAFCTGLYYGTPLQSTTLEEDDVKGVHTLHVSYEASTRMLTVEYAGKTCARKLNLPGKNLAKVRMSASIHYEISAPLDTESKIEGEFVSAKYTHYQPQFVSTELLDEDGNTMTDAEKMALQDGDVVTVRSTVKNNHPEAGAEIVYAHLNLVPEGDEKAEKYPTAGLDILQGDEQTVTVDGKTVVGEDGNPYDVSGEGIPIGVSAAGNVITYKAKINNPDGETVTVGQRMSDDFFGSKQYSSAELVPAQPLTPGDPEKPEGEAGKDYHYTRTAPNENGWNNSDVAITFYPGDFDKFYIKDPKEGTVEAALTSEEAPLIYSDETEKPVALQAENSGNGAKSVRKDDVIKVDKVPPSLSTAAPALLTYRSARTAPAQSATLTDNLSGVWKLERYDAAAQEWVTAQTFELPTEGANKGNGNTSESAAIGQNGLYRTVDAAGNVGAATPVSFNAPPSATPKDPDAPALEPEEETDEGGLRHATAADSMEEYVDRENPLYGGRFTLEDAQGLFAERYDFASQVARDDTLSYSYTIAQEGEDVSGAGVDTAQAGAFTVTCVVTDADGNTTTLTLTDTLIDPNAPPLVERQEEGAPPVGPAFDPLKPAPQPVVKEDPETGRAHAYVYETITEAVGDPAAYGGKLTGGVAQQIFAGRYGFVSQQGDDTLTLSPIAVTKEGVDVAAAGYDTRYPGSCVISQTATDSRGNKTTVYLTYTFLPAGSPPWVDYDPSDPTVEPGSELEEPEIVEDWQSGTKYATVTDRLVQAVSDPPLSGGWLDGEELRAFLRSRYQFTSAQPDGMLKETRFAITQNGKAVEGIDTTRPGEYLIAYTLEDSAGNRTSLFLQYRLQEGTIAGGVEESETPFTGMEGADWSDGRGGSGGGLRGGLQNGCPIHWLALLGTLVTLGHLGLSRLLSRRREEDEEGQSTRRVGLGRALLLALLTAAAAFLATRMRCGYDLPALLLWAAAIVLDMAAPERGRRKERAEG